MESWLVLPDAPLAAVGPDPEAFLRLGCVSYRSAARHLHELPYGRNMDRADFRLVLSEGRGTCSTKHALLAAVAREQHLPVSLAIGIYDMSERNTPGVGRILSAHAEDDAKNIAWARASYDALRPHMARGSYANYQTEDEAEGALDPTNLLHLNNNVRPTA